MLKKVETPSTRHRRKAQQLPSKVFKFLVWVFVINKLMFLLDELETIDGSIHNHRQPVNNEKVHANHIHVGELSWVLWGSLWRQMELHELVRFVLDHNLQLLRHVASRLVDESLHGLFAQIGNWRPRVKQKEDIQNFVTSIRSCTATRHADH